MPDVQCLRLSRNWALAHDARQWIIKSRTGKNGNEKWEGRKFVPTTAADLRRTIAKLNIRVSPEAARELEALPPTFGAFLAQRGVDRPRDDMRSKRYGKSAGKKARSGGGNHRHSAFTVLDGERVPEAA